LFRLERHAGSESSLSGQHMYERPIRYGSVVRAISVPRSRRW
jgi:hypothetical protein